MADSLLSVSRTKTKYGHSRRQPRGFFLEENIKINESALKIIISNITVITEVNSNRNNYAFNMLECNILLAKSRKGTLRTKLS